MNKKANNNETSLVYKALGHLIKKAQPGWNVLIEESLDKMSTELGFLKTFNNEVPADTGGQEAIVNTILTMAVESKKIKEALDNTQIYCSSTESFLQSIGADWLSLFYDDFQKADVDSRVYFFSKHLKTAVKLEIPPFIPHELQLCIDGVLEKMY